MPGRARTPLQSVIGLLCTRGALQVRHGFHGALAFGAVQPPGVRNQRGFHSTMFFTVELTLGARVCSKQSFPKSHRLSWVMPANNIVRKRE